MRNNVIGVMLSLSKHLCKQRAGVSLLISIIFISVFMLVIVSLTQVQLNTIRNMKNAQDSLKTLYLGESVSHMAAYWAAEAPLGSNGSLATQPVFLQALIDTAAEAGFAGCDDIDPNPLAADEPCVEFKVVGRAETAEQQVDLLGEKFFSIPVRGTGDAGKGCNPQSASNPGAGDSDLNPESADAPCNWNKIFVGQTAEVPLFYEESPGVLGAQVGNANFNDGTSKFILRVRAPCANFAVSCDAVNRITLYPPEPSATASVDYRDVKKDPVLVQWLIYDKANAGQSTLVARDEKSSTDTTKRPGTKSESYKNSEISAGRINIAKDPKTLPFSPTVLADTLENFVVLFYNSGSVDTNNLDKHSGKDLDNQYWFIGQYIQETGKNPPVPMQFPIFRLSLVGQPQKEDPNVPDTNHQDPNETKNNIPYLEYQILSKNVQISDTKSFIYASADIGDFSKTFTKVQKRPTTSGGFAIENF